MAQQMTPDRRPRAKAVGSRLSARALHWRRRFRPRSRVSLSNGSSWLLHPPLTRDGTGRRYSAFPLTRNPGVDARFQYVEGQRARTEHLVVEASQVETRAQGRRRARPQLLDLELADLVGQGLGRPDDVAVHLDHDVVLGLARVLREVVDGLLPAPAQRVHARVHDQPDGPPDLVGELAELRVGIVVEAHLGPEALRVEPPALDVGGVEAVPAEIRHLRQLLGDGDLE